jgi:hypothetical protein
MHQQRLVPANRVLCDRDGRLTKRSVEGGVVPASRVELEHTPRACPANVFVAVAVHCRALPCPS